MKNYGGIYIKNIPNLITFSRILCGMLLIFTVAFSKMFWLLYLYGGITDFIDGLIARKLNYESDLGAKLDSIADVTFLIGIVIVVIPNIAIPMWIWICVSGIGLIRITAYGVGYIKHRTFSSLHTYSNKVAGVLLYMTPVIYVMIDITVLTVIVVVVAFFSSIEELLITVLYNDLNRDRKSVFDR